MRNLCFAMLALFLLSSCEKNEKTDTIEVSTGAYKEPSQEQEPMKIKNESGEELTVTYFAEGDMIAVKIEKPGEAAQKLSAKTTNAAGNPIFTNENYMWELTEEGKGGKLSDKEGKSSEYK